MLHSHIWVNRDTLNNLIVATLTLVFFSSFDIITEYVSFVITNVSHLVLAVKEEIFHLWQKIVC
jgi:hypothetical protein